MTTVTTDTYNIRAGYRRFDVTVAPHNYRNGEWHYVAKLKGHDVYRFDCPERLTEHGIRTVLRAYLDGRMHP